MTCFTSKCSYWKLSLCKVHTILVAIDIQCTMSCLRPNRPDLECVQPAAEREAWPVCPPSRTISYLHSKWQVYFGKEAAPESVRQLFGIKSHQRRKKEKKSQRVNRPPPQETGGCSTTLDLQPFQGYFFVIIFAFLFPLLGLLNSDFGLDRYPDILTKANWLSHDWAAVLPEWLKTQGEGAKTAFMINVLMIFIPKLNRSEQFMRLFLFKLCMHLNAVLCHLWPLTVTVATLS